ncbi:hypothetical protein J8F10_23960 [Gemmata sp. G18]|uniref:Uncharacterized protein n=1 Tax=Gemmata palustris TaxID=2822762 RepID=A0ABS5BX49_9BACT|nr:hypothetical protein [Gemmata palustris]MBP3958315.1 hypothetical protein [Gemmata palustris]
MPIVESPVLGYPLSQGDILRGVTLFLTRANGTEAAATKFKFCLVVSRPCVLAHKPQIIVVGVKEYSEGVPHSVNTFEKVIDFMTVQRDGDGSPDQFYLGQLPGESGRFCARLDSFHTIEIPTRADARQQFVDGHRIAALSADFQRALHTRIFSAFAEMGFDDHAWPSDTDLEWLVAQGRADIKKLDGEAEQLRAAKSSHVAAGKEFTQDGQLEKIEKNLEVLQGKVAPYEAELERRLRTRDLPMVEAPPPPPQ